MFSSGFISVSMWMWMTWFMSSSETSPLCTSGINTHKGVCYWLIPAAVYDTQKDRCVRSGGTLAVIDSAQTQTFLEHYLNEARLTATSLIIPYIGLNKNNLGWDDSTPIVYTNYGNNQPDNPGDNCWGLFFFDNWKWHDFGCLGVQYALCQLPVVPKVGSGQTFKVTDSPGTGTVVEAPDTSTSATLCCVQCATHVHCLLFKFNTESYLCSLYHPGIQNITSDDKDVWYAYQ